MSAREYWKSRFDEYPQNDAEKLAVAMMAEYARDRTERLQVEKDVLEKELSKDFEVRLKEFQYAINSVEATLEAPYIKSFLSGLIDIYTNQGGPNYMSLRASKGGNQYEILVQRLEGKTPAELVTEQSARIRELEEALEQARNTMLTVHANSSLSFVKPVNEINRILNKAANGSVIRGEEL